MNILLHTHVCPAHPCLPCTLLRHFWGPPISIPLFSPTVTPSTAPRHPHLCVTLSLTGSPAVTCS